jgi:hypothetical protein
MGESGLGGYGEFAIIVLLCNDVVYNLGKVGCALRVI